jgi:hypothetical protein
MLNIFWKKMKQVFNVVLSRVLFTSAEENESFFFTFLYYEKKSAFEVPGIIGHSYISINGR